MNAAPDPVLLFDGECGLCQRIVRVLLRLDRAGRLRYAPLQGAAARDFHARHGLPTADFASLVFVPDWSQRDRPDFSRRTDGAIAALRTCGAIGEELAAVIGALPAPWRDAVYRGVARWRHRIFGAWTPRPLPAAIAARFLE